MRTVAIVQARLASTRLPGKVLLPINGKPMLWHVINRTRQAKTVGEVVVATSHTDRHLYRWCWENSIPCYRGGENEDDVLGRYYTVAARLGVDVIVRITGDCPMIDAVEIDRVVESLRPGCEYMTNAMLGYETLPDGLDCEVFTFKALAEANERAKLQFEREHVTPLIRRTPTAGFLLNDRRYAHLRFCVDDPQDLVFARAVFAELGNDFAWMDVVRLLDRKPEIAALMGRAKRNEGYRRVLEADNV